MSAYDDIIDLPRPVSKKHPPMPIADRAAQFSPFAALTGFGAAITETARITGEKPELSEQEHAKLDEKLHSLLKRLPDAPAVTITYFQPDERKSGGALITADGFLKRIDAYARAIVFSDGRTIPLDDVTDVSTD